MIRKLIVLVSSVLLILSCSSTIAKSQFERGDYKNSVRTTLSYAGGKEFYKLKQEEKQELINRFSIIDNHYRTAYTNNEIANLNKMYDIFIINQMLNNEIYIKQYFPFITSQNMSYYIYEIEQLSMNLIKRDAYSIENVLSIKKDMEKNNILNSIYSGEYIRISKALADEYLLKFKYANLENGYQYIKKAYSSVYDFEPNYRNIYTLYKETEKKIELEYAKKYISDGKQHYFDKQYDEAIDQFEKAKEILSKYYPSYDYNIKDVQEYIDRAKEKINQKKIIYYKIDDKSEYKELIRNFFKKKGFIEVVYNYDAIINYTENYKYSYRETYNNEYEETLLVESNVYVNNQIIKYSKNEYKNRSWNRLGKEELIRRYKQNSYYKTQNILENAFR